MIRGKHMLKNLRDISPVWGMEVEFEWVRERYLSGSNISKFNIGGGYTIRQTIEKQFLRC